MPIDLLASPQKAPRDLLAAPASTDTPRADGPSYNAGHAFQSGATQGMTLGFADELAAGMMTPIEMVIDAVQGKSLDPGRSFNQVLSGVRGMEADMQAQSPELALAGNLTGGLATGVGAASNGLTLMNAAKPTIASMLPRAAAEGAAYGAVTGFGSGDSLSDRIGGAAEGAAWGAGVGGALGGIGGAMASRAAQKAIPSVDDLKADASALYDAASNSGITFPGQATKILASDITAEVMTQGIDPTLHPRATAVLKRLQDISDSGMTVREAQTMRRVLAASGKDVMNPDEQRIASIMVRKFDDFVSQSVPELQQANGLYHRASKGQVIEDTIQRAKDMAGPNYSASGLENAVRQQFKSLLLNKRALRGFSDDEIAAIRRVSEGGPIENAMRYLGRMAPTGNIGVATTFGTPTLAGMALGNPVAGAAVGGAAMAGGAAARGAASNMTLNNARMAAAIARSGGNYPKRADPAIGGVLQALSSLGGQQIPQYAPNTGILSRMMALN